MQFIMFTRAKDMIKVAIHVDLIGRLEEERGMFGSVRYGCRIYCRRGRANWKVVEPYLDILEQIKRATTPRPADPVGVMIPADLHVETIGQPTVTRAPDQTFATGEQKADAKHQETR